MFHKCLALYFIGIWTGHVTLTDANEAIVGGTRAEENQFPYQVFTDLRNHRCGGAIIGDQFILTAAHCVVHVINHPDPQRVFVAAGTNNMFRLNPPTVVIPIQKIFVPTEYNITDLSTNGDIAVLQLSKPLQLSRNRHLKKLKLPTNQRETYVNRTAIISGFGWTWTRLEGRNTRGNNTNGYLHFAEADVLSTDECQISYLTIRITNKNLCARIRQVHNQKHGSGRGDSGSPLVVDNKTIIGVLSRGPDLGSERERAAIYTRVSHYLTFIFNAIKGKTTRNMIVKDLHPELVGQI